MRSPEGPKPLSLGFEKDPGRRVEKKDLPPREESAKDRWTRELAEFIVEANRETWAADKGRVEPTRPGFKRHVHERGDWRLDDEYTGYFKAPGMTTVYYKGVPVWVMQYGGEGMDMRYKGLAKETYAFLRRALLMATPELPYRGPENYTRGDWLYGFSISRNPDITNFEADETIWAPPHGKPVFSQTITGGIIIHKRKQGKPVYPWDL